MSHKYRKHISTQFNTFIRVFSKDIHGLPRPILRVILAIGLFSFGWGPADALFSLFLSTFTDDYSTIGLLRTLTALGGALVLLPVGDLLDRVRHDVIIRGALIAYVFIGVGYTLAGEWLFLPLLVVVTVAHGSSSAIIWAAAEATLREQSTSKNSALVFGLHATVFHTLWAIGMLVMVLFAESIPLHYTFIPVSVFSLVALAVMRKSEPERNTQPFAQALKEVVVRDKLIIATLRKVKQFPKEIWLMYLMHFAKLSLLAFIHGFLVLFLEEAGASLAQITGFVAVSTLPFLFSFIAAELADRTERLLNIAAGYTIAALGIGSLLVFGTETWQVYVAATVATLGAAIVNPSIHGVVSMLTPKEYSGEGTAMLDLVKFVSITVSALFFGYMIDHAGWNATIAVVSAFCFLLVLFVFAMRHRYQRLNMIYHINHPDSKNEPYIL